MRADVRDCVCDLASPGISEASTCSLCLEAEKHLVNEPPFQLSSPDRVAMWKMAIAKGRELWGDGWAVALNGDIARRQCHEHVQIGKLLDGKETANAIYVDGPSDLPLIADGTGLWFRPAGTRLHVHQGEQINETVLMR